MNITQEKTSNAKAFLDMLKQAHPDLHRIFKAIMALEQYGGNGSLEIHLLRGHIKTKQGLYIKPGFDDSSIDSP